MRFPAWPYLAWPCAALAGLVVPALAILLLADAAAPLASAGGPIFAVGLMGSGMIGAAAGGSLRFGVFLALATGAGLIILSLALGMSPPSYAASIGLAFVTAAISFAARGALFARSASEKGWIIALGVVGGEAAVVATAFAAPGALPDWLLALLPAQWASTAIQTALAGTGMRAAIRPLVALAGTAAATLLVSSLWPRRWPYLVMFTTWIGVSALVLYGA
ncbi:MAG: hypothetical protein RIC51_11610 [Erythrobacter sp.]